MLTICDVSDVHCLPLAMLTTLSTSCDAVCEGWRSFAQSLLARNTLKSLGVAAIMLGILLGMCCLEWPCNIGICGKTRASCRQLNWTAARLSYTYQAPGQALTEASQERRQMTDLASSPCQWLHICHQKEISDSTCRDWRCNQSQQLHATQKVI